MISRIGASKPAPHSRIEMAFQLLIEHVFVNPKEMIHQRAKPRQVRAPTSAFDIGRWTFSSTSAVRLLASAIDIHRRLLCSRLPRSFKRRSLAYRREALANQHESLALKHDIVAINRQSHANNRGLSAN